MTKKSTKSILSYGSLVVETVRFKVKSIETEIGSEDLARLNWY